MVNGGHGEGISVAVSHFLIGSDNTVDGDHKLELQ